MEAERPASVTVLGSINMDVVVRTKRFPKPGETILASTVERHGGGKGANQALAAARAGANVRLVGSIGNDSEGRILLSMLQESGVDCAHVRVDADLPTGSAYVLVNEAGENQIIVAAGANENAIDEAGEHEGVLLAQLELPLHVVSSFLARRHHPPLTILNAAPYREGATRLFELVDLVVINETELAAYCGVSEVPADEDALAAHARGLLGREEQQIIVTRGARGSVAISRDGFFLTAAPSINVVDTTGAGDCFCGYLAAELGARRGLASAIKTAHRAAALSVGAKGASSAIPTMSEVARLFAD